MFPLPCRAVTEFPHTCIGCSLRFWTGPLPISPAHGLPAKRRGKVTPKEGRDVTCRGAADAGSTAAEKRGSGPRPLRGKLRPSPAPAPPRRPQAPVAAAGAVPGRRCSAQRAAGSSSGRRAPAPPSPFPPLPPSAPGWARPRQPGCGVLPCRAPCAMDWQVLTRELSLYLENQVRVGFFGSGVGLSLVLGFGVAYACYYLNSIAKVSGRAAGRAGSAGGDSPADGDSREGHRDPPPVGEGIAPGMAGGWGGGQGFAAALASNPSSVPWRCRPGVPAGRNPARALPGPGSAASPPAAAASSAGTAGDPRRPPACGEGGSPGPARSGRGRGSGLGSPQNATVPVRELGRVPWFGKGG